MGTRPAAATNPLGANSPSWRSSRSTRLPLTCTPCSPRSRARSLRSPHSKRRGDQHLADQLDQVGVADRGGRPRPGSLLAMAAGRDRGAGAPSTRHPPSLVAGGPWLAGPLRRRIWTPLCSAAARRTSFSMVSWPSLRSACRNARSSGDRSGRWPFRPPCRLREVIPPRGQPVRLHLQLPGELFDRLAAQQPQHGLHLLARRPSGRDRWSRSARVDSGCSPP